MSKRRHLGNAPIQEALIDIKFDPVSHADVSAAAETLANGETAQILDLWNTMFEFKVELDQQPAAQQSTQIGKRVDFPERGHVVQLHNGSFTFSRLAPYKDWQEMIDAALALWRHYADLLRVQRVTRVAVRYINLIDLPLPIENFGDFLESPPVIPNGIPQGLAGFLTRMTIPLGQHIAIVTQSLEGGQVEYRGGQALRMVLDIDVSHQEFFERERFSEIGRILGRLRDAKNDVFFSFVTERTVEQYI